MYIDAMTLEAVAGELRILLAGARIDTIIQPTEHAIALQCYAPGQREGGRTAGSTSRPTHNLPGHT